MHHDRVFIYLYVITHDHELIYMIMHIAITLDDQINKNCMLGN